MGAHQPGWTYRLMARDNGALADFNLAIALWPDADETVAEQRKPSKIQFRIDGRILDGMAAISALKRAEDVTSGGSPCAGALADS